MEKSETTVQIREEALPSGGLLSFYDSLRARAVAAPKSRFGQRGVGLLVLIPDVLVLVARLSIDKRVPKETRTLFAGALAYFLLPVDLLPEALLGMGGFGDDLVLALAVLNHAFGRNMSELAEDHWSGSQDLRTVVAEVLGTAHLFLGGRVYERLLSLLRKRGIELTVPDQLS